MERKIRKWVQSQGKERVPLEKWDEEYILKTAAKMATVGCQPKSVLSDVVKNIDRRPKQIGTSMQDWETLRVWFSENKLSSSLKVELKSKTFPGYSEKFPVLRLISDKDKFELVFDVFRGLYLNIDNFEIWCGPDISIKNTNTEDLGKIALKVYDQREALKNAYREVEVQIGKYKMLSKIQRKVISKITQEFKSLCFSKTIKDSDHLGRPGCIVTISPYRTFHGKLFVIIPYDASIEEIRQIFRETEKELDIMSHLQYLQGDFITPIKYVAAKTKKRKKGHGSRQDQGRDQDRSQGHLQTHAQINQCTD